MSSSILGDASNRASDCLRATIRAVRFGCVQAIVCAVLLFCCGAAGAAGTAQEDVAGLLRRADDIKSANYAEFTNILGRLDAKRGDLSPQQRAHLDYLKGWQLAYVADFDKALAALAVVARETDDATLRFRTEATTANVLTIARRYEAALKHLNAMLALLPTVKDPGIRGQGLLTAAQIHTQVGQFDVASEYARQVIRETPNGKVLCQALQLQLEARFRSRRMEANDPGAQQGLAACIDSGEFVFANFIRTVIGRIFLRAGRTDEAIALLLAHYDEVQATRYARLIAEYDALLAQAWWKKRELAKARAFAQRAVDRTDSKDITQPLVEASRILYLIAREQGDSAAALTFHETYAAADKRFLDDIGARELAFQMVKSQATANRLQIEALGKRNQMLQLQETVSKAAAQTRGLFILLLLSVLAFIAMWLYITKRSQLHFMKLARRDGLTGIFNRAHFADAAEAILAYCRKGEREACVVLIDLDHFKRVNDKFGHAAGDAVLRRTVQACQAHLRSIDIMGRLGGEEFGIVLPDCDPERARNLAEQFRLAILDIGSADSGVGFTVSASFGVTSSSWSGYNLRQLIIHADKALYTAKHNGRNRVELFENGGAAPPDVAALQPGSFDRRSA